MSEKSIRRIREIKTRRKRLFIKKLVLVLAVFIIAGFILPRMTLYAKAAGKPQKVYKYYTDVIIHSGDTLSLIADKYYTDDFSSKEAYISEVKFINHLTTDKIIVGTSLIVPYYSVIEKH